MRNKLLTLILAVALCFSMSFVLACNKSEPKISGSTVNVEIGQTAELFSAEEGVALADVTVNVKNQSIATWTSGSNEVTGVAQGLTAAEVTYEDTTITVYINVIDNTKLAELESKLTASTNDLESKLGAQKQELLTKIDETKTALDAAIDELGVADIDGLTEELAKLETKANAAASIEEVKGLVDDLKETVTSMNTALSGKIDDLSADTQTKIDTVTSSVSALATRVAAAETEINNIKTDIENLKKDIESTQNAGVLPEAKLAAKIELMPEVYAAGYLGYDFKEIDAATTVEEIEAAKAAIRETITVDIKEYKANAAAEIIVTYEKELAGIVASFESVNAAAVKEATTREREVAFVRIILANTLAEVDDIVNEYKDNCTKIVEDYKAMEAFVAALEEFYSSRTESGIVLADADAIATLDAQYEALSKEAKELFETAKAAVKFEDDAEAVEVEATDAYAMIDKIYDVVKQVNEVYVAGDEAKTPLVVGGVTINEELVVIDDFLVERKEALTAAANAYEALADYAYYMKGDLTPGEDRDGGKAKDIVDLLHSEEYAEEFIEKFVQAEIAKVSEDDTTEYASYNAFITALYNAKISSEESRAWKQVNVKAPQVPVFWAFYNGLVGKLDGANTDAVIEGIPAAPAADATEVDARYYEDLRTAYVVTADAALAAAKEVYVYGTKTAETYAAEGVAVDLVYTDRTAAVVGETSVKAVYNTTKANVVSADYFAESVAGNYDNIIANYETAYAGSVKFINLLINETEFGGEAGVFTAARTAFQTTLTTAYEALDDFAKLYVIDLPMDVYTVYTALTNSDILTAYEANAATVDAWTKAEGANEPNEKVFNETYTAEAAATMIETYLAAAKNANEVMTAVAPYATETKVDAKTRTTAMAKYDAYVKLITDRVASDYVTAANNATAVTVDTHYNENYEAAKKFLEAVIAHSFDAYTENVTTGEGEDATTEEKAKYETFYAGYTAEKAALAAFAQSYIDAAMANLVNVYGEYALNVTAVVDLSGLAAIKTEYADFEDEVFGTYDLGTDEFTTILTTEVVDKLVADYVTSVEATKAFAAALYAGAMTMEKATTLKDDLAAVYEPVAAQVVTTEYLNAVYGSVYADYLKLYGAITADETGKVTVPEISAYETVDAWMDDYVATGVALAKTLAENVAANASGEICVAAYEALTEEAPLAYFYLSDELQEAYRVIERNKLINDAIENIAIQVSTYAALEGADLNEANISKIASTVSTWFKVFDEYLKTEEEIADGAKRIDSAAATRGFTKATVEGTEYTDAYEAARALVKIPDLIAANITAKIDAFNTALDAFYNTPNTGVNAEIKHGTDLNTLFNNEDKEGMSDISAAITELKTRLEYYTNIKTIADYTYGEGTLAAAVEKVGTDLTAAIARKEALQAAIDDILANYTVAVFKVDAEGYTYELDYLTKQEAFKAACTALDTNYNYDWTNDADISKNMAEVDALCHDISQLISGITGMNTIYFTAVPASVAGMPFATEEEKQAIRDALIATNNYSTEQINNIVLRMSMTDAEILDAMEANVLALETQYGYIVAKNTSVQAKIDAVKNDMAVKEDQAVAGEWLAEVNNFSAATPQSDVAKALEEAYNVLLKDGVLGTDTVKAEVKEAALKLQEQVAADSKELQDLYAAYTAAQDAVTAAQEKVDTAASEEEKTAAEAELATAQEALTVAETAYNEAKTAFGYVFENEDGTKTLVCSVASYGGNAWPFFFDLKTELGCKTLVVSNIQ